MVVDQLLLFGLVISLAAALPISVIAALGFKNSPFGKVTVPLPFVFAAYILADGIRLVVDQPPILYYIILTTVAMVGVVYVAANAFLLLTERRAI